jgi:hypothetical protein
MKALSKTHKEQLDKMIKEDYSINAIKGYCKGAGIDTTKYSSGVHIGAEKITIRYRNKNTYHQIRQF